MTMLSRAVAALWLLAFVPVVPLLAGPSHAETATPAAAAETAGPAPALSLRMPPGARIHSQEFQSLGNYRMPIGPWRDGQMPTREAEGVVRIQVWRIPDRHLSTMQLLVDLRQQLEAYKFEILFGCETENCGGFDFRFHTKVLPEPQMHVDLGDFRFIAASRPEAGGLQEVSLMISRSAEAAYVQVIDVAPPSAHAPSIAAAAVAGAASAPAPQNAESLIAALKAGGAVALDDLDFASGSANLSPGGYASLAALAAYLNANPGQTVALVGHTDDSGDLGANIALSKQRAESVARRLEQNYGVNPRQLDAEGVGYLAPRASNLTAAGRSENRRVEVMLTSTP